MSEELQKYIENNIISRTKELYDLVAKEKKVCEYEKRSLFENIEYLLGTIEWRISLASHFSSKGVECSDDVEKALVAVNRLKQIVEERHPFSRDEDNNYAQLTISSINETLENLINKFLIVRANEQLKKEYYQVSERRREEMRKWVRENYQALQNFISLWTKEVDLGLVKKIVCKCGAEIVISRKFRFSLLDILEHAERMHEMNVSNFRGEEFVKFFSWWLKWSTQEQKGILRHGNY
jgi:predicted transcriptional regulator